MFFMRGILCYYCITCYLLWEKAPHVTFQGPWSADAGKPGPRLGRDPRGLADGHWFLWTPTLLPRKREFCWLRCHRMYVHSDLQLPAWVKCYPNQSTEMNVIIFTLTQTTQQCSSGRADGGPGAARRRRPDTSLHRGLFLPFFYRTTFSSALTQCSSSLIAGVCWGRGGLKQLFRKCNKSHALVSIIFLLSHLHFNILHGGPDAVKYDMHADHLECLQLFNEMYLSI